MEIIYKNIEDIIPYANNPRHNENAIPLVAESIAQFGFKVPIVIDKNNVVVAGHTRLASAKTLNYKEVPCIVADDLTDDQIKAFRLADNKVAEAATWDIEKLDIELDEIQMDMSDFGFEIESVDFFDREYHGGNERQEGNDEYNDFLDKFEVAKTTDDCYTPQVVFDAIEKWVRDEYKITDKTIRPFYPGGDYQKENYDSKVVIDNPPFSILSEIISWYNERGIKYFLFAPSVACFRARRQACAVCIGTTITYENGAKIATSFVTNLENNVARTSPELYKVASDADEINREGMTKHIPSYEYPNEVITAAMMSKLSKYGQTLIIKDTDASEKIGELDSQKEFGKRIFGGAYLLSEKAAAEKAAAEKAAAEKAAAEKAAATVWALSDREKEIIKSLGQKP
jgi:hypothetical protein